MAGKKGRRWSNAECGSNAGYMQHLYHGTEKCEACQLAKREYNRLAMRIWRGRRARFGQATR